MRKIVLLNLLAVLFFACGQQNKNTQVTNEKEVQAVVLTVDDLLEKAPGLADKEVVVTGTVFHVCQQGGERCFIMGSTEDLSIRIEAGEKIGAFTQEQMGSDLQITGILKEVKTEADAHNPGQEHGTSEEHAENAETESAHEIIAANQEAAERVFFIEAIEAEEL